MIARMHAPCLATETWHPVSVASRAMIMTTNVALGSAFRRSKWLRVILPSAIMVKLCQRKLISHVLSN